MSNNILFQRNIVLTSLLNVDFINFQSFLIVHMSWAANYYIM